jgi:hypothetical protein
MTRKHYVAIAEAVSLAYSEAEPGDAALAVRNLAAHLADVLAKDIRGSIGNDS